MCLKKDASSEQQIITQGSRQKSGEPIVALHYSFYS